LNIKEFAETNRLQLNRPIGWPSKAHNDKVDDLIFGRYGELADMGDEGLFRLRLLAVPRAKATTKALLNRRRQALAAGLELKWKGDAESIFYFNPANSAQASIAIGLVGAKVRRVLTEDQRQAAAGRLAAFRAAKVAA
jgi:hypothetical protein